MKGGFIEEVTNSISSGLNSLSQGVTETYEKAKNAVTGNPAPAPPAASSYIPVSSPMSRPASYGGKKNDRKKRTKKHMRGGFSDNIATTGLASSAEPISGIKTAQPHNLVGGKSKRRHRNKKSRKSKKTTSRRR